ncbi:M50 family metallopeptidase [Hyalangium versicolor]|uniref:M50 family metallopeptidase n=1 Tax=Hyalangium versicolor TaxID=2861190 RepID=UPI001CCD354B|nr:M50 family metallopeptidase [Hyalangium versicolor]
MYVLLALLALGLLLAVHELGHLLAARLLGVSVPRFSLGFGPPLLSFHLFGTEYVVAAIPLGASTTLHGMNPHVPGLDPADPRSYSAQRPWKRVVITLAGSVANYLFALGVLFVLYTSGTHVVVPLTVGTVTPGSEAARAQLLPGDRILSVDGQPMKSWSDFVEFIGASPGRDRSLVVSRHDEARVVQVRPRPDERGVGRIGVSQQYVYREHKPGEALAQSLVHSQRVATEALGLVWSLVVGRNPAAEPPSTVAVVRQSSGAASSGRDAFLRVLVAMSVALSLLHLVPIPGLDGGRLLFLAIELARGRPVSSRVETFANTLGFLAIAAAIIAVSVAEVRRALPLPEPHGDSGPAPLPSLALTDGGDSSSPGSSHDAGVLTPDAGGTSSKPGSLSDAGVLTPDAGGTSTTGMVSDGGRPSPAAGGTSSTATAPDGGLPPPDAGGPTGPGSAPDAGAPLVDAGAADAG